MASPPKTKTPPSPLVVPPPSLLPPNVSPPAPDKPPRLPPRTPATPPLLPPASPNLASPPPPTSDNNAPPPPAASSPPPAATSPPTNDSSPPPSKPPSQAPPTFASPPPSPSPPTFASPPHPSISPPYPPTKISPPSKSGNHSSPTGVRSTPGPPDSPTNNDQAVRTGVAIGVGAAVVVIVFLLVILIRRKRKHSRYNSVYMLPSPYSSPQLSKSGSSFMKAHSTGLGSRSIGSDLAGSMKQTSNLGSSQAWFSYEDLNTATNGFAPQNILGAGGFGCVYKGLLQDGKEVAIKKLKDNSGQGDREFKAEVEIISRVHHRDLVSLVGYCITEYQRLLVYEFVPNGTLHHHIHSSRKPPMEWAHRVKVACGAARGIAYLHEDCHPKIIHRDIKSANILVENDFEAKVADFGLAKIAQELGQHTHISTRVMGTFGYMAPEYASSGKLTEKSDVFSFGVVLLEIITGRKPVDESRPLGDESLVEWARPLMTEALECENFDELADPRLEGRYDRGEMFRLIEAAAACVRQSAVKRPKMSQVVRAMETMNELTDISNGTTPGQSGIFNTREQSAQMRIFQRMAFGSQDFTSEAYNNRSDQV